ncbi:MAG: hypothetical protein JST59_00650 [Actinobacteria bacterium]|nr:hypothetical protein [Actinomycetota bacterium]
MSLASLLITVLVEANCNDLKTFSTVAERVFFYNAIFALLVYITLPLVFTLLSLVKPGVGNYVVVEQATIIIVTQVIVSVVDPKYYVWRTRRSLLLGNGFESFKHNQRRLHELVECIEYPVLDKLLVVMRICSYAFGFSFVSPYIPVVLFVSLLVIYIFEKRNVYRHYRTAELNISVILYAFVYSSIASEAIMCIFLSTYLVLQYGMPLWVLAITVPLLVPAWWIKIHLYRNRYSKRPDESLEMSTLESPGLQDGLRVSQIKSLA